MALTLEQQAGSSRPCTSRDVLRLVTQPFKISQPVAESAQVAEGHAGDANKSTTDHSQELVQEIEAEEAHIQLDQLGIDSLDALCTQLFTLRVGYQAGRRTSGSNGRTPRGPGLKAAVLQLLQDAAAAHQHQRNDQGEVGPYLSCSTVAGYWIFYAIKLTIIACAPIPAASEGTPPPIMTMKQLNTWFSNMRARHWKPITRTDSERREPATPFEARLLAAAASVLLSEQAEPTDTGDSEAVAEVHLPALDMESDDYDLLNFLEE
eukprot:3110-Heterococcus_DN1.PRE.2